MKLCFLLFVAIMLVTAECRPKEKEKTDKKNKKKVICGDVCPAVYEPVCAKDPSDPASRPRTFGNTCVLSLHNCQNHSNLEVVSKGECKGSGGVRLS